METIYKIETFEDLLKALRERKDWLEQLRALILTEEILNLPRRFEEFLEKDFRPLKEKIDTIEKDVKILEGDVETLKNDVVILKTDVETLKNDVVILKTDVETLKNDVAILKTDVETLKNDVKILKADVAELKGDNFERKVRERAPAYFGRIIKRCKIIQLEELADILDDAVDNGLILEEERNDVINVDVVVTGVLKEDWEKKVTVVAEVSYKADRTDVERAYKRSKVIEKVLGMPAISVVIGNEFTEGAISLAEELNVVI